jgi:5'(3')-deoxyribonucleotidase
MNRPTILIDVDGVLADFATPAVRWACALGAPDTLDARTLTHYDIAGYVPEQNRRKWWERVTGRGFCAALKPYTNAAESVLKLQRIGDVVAVTAPMDSPHWEYERRVWLKDVFGFHRENVISTSGKYHVPGDFYADDSIDHLTKWTFRWRATRRAFLIDAPYNVRTHINVARGSLPDFVTYVREYLATAAEHGQEVAHGLQR